MCKKARTIESTVQIQSKIRIVHWIALDFLRRGRNYLLAKTEHFKHIGWESKHPAETMEN